MTTQRNKVKLSDVLGLLGVGADSASDALVAADDEEGGLLAGLNLGDVNIIDLLVSLIGEIKVTDGFIEIGLAAGLLD